MLSRQRLQSGGAPVAGYKPSGEAGSALNLQPQTPHLAGATGQPVRRNVASGSSGSWRDKVQQAESTISDGLHNLYNRMTGKPASAGSNTGGKNASSPASGHVLKADPNKTLQETYTGKPAYKNAKGEAQCVELIKQTLGAPTTPNWKEGKKITKGDTSIPPGTPIATFVGGKYPQGQGKQAYGNQHAAIYLGQNDQGIVVLEQSKDHDKLSVRTIKWTNPNNKGLSNNGSAFSVIEWDNPAPAKGSMPKARK